MRLMPFLLSFIFLAIMQQASADIALTCSATIGNRGEVLDYQLTYDKGNYYIYLNDQLNQKSNSIVVTLIEKNSPFVLENFYFSSRDGNIQMHIGPVGLDGNREVAMVYFGKAYSASCWGTSIP
jgi:hypothetical protein